MEAISFKLGESSTRVPFAELARPIVMQRPSDAAPPYAWAGHIPFAFWLIDTLRPKLTVELGTHMGNSYFAFCQALKQCQIPGAKSVAVDTWCGDSHAGFYGEDVFERVSRINEQYSSFSTLKRMTFDEAVPEFADRSIDLLHIDGLHTYEAVKHDFESWLPKLSERAIVLFHDTNVWERDFGVWKLWAELALRYPGIELKHSHGLGVLAVGAKVAENLKWIFGLERNGATDVTSVQEFFAFLGNLLRENLEAAAHSTPSSGSGESSVSSPSPVTTAPAAGDSVRYATESPPQESLPSVDEVAAVEQKAHLEYERRTAQLQAELLRAQTRLGYYADLIKRYQSLSEWAVLMNQRLEFARIGRAWRVMRSLSRAQALLVRREDEGRVGFLKYVVRKLLGRPYALRRSFDPFEGLPPPPIEDGVDQDLEVNTELPVLRQPEVIFEQAPESGRCDVIIPIHGALHWVELCLRALFVSANQGLVSSVILVDDGSSPEEAALILKLAKDYPCVSVIRNISPSGFGAACNAGASFSKAPFLLFLNSDCLVAPGTIAALLNVLARERSVGMVCPIANSAANLSVDIPAGRSFIELDRVLAGQARGNSLTHDACTVVGHCLMVNRDCWEVTGGFDLSWGRGYGEESDLQMRAERKGWYAAVTGDTFVYHFGGGSFGAIARERALLQTRNHKRFMRMWGGEYRKLERRALGRDVVRESQLRLSAALPAQQHIDVLFVLPGVRQDVGGLHVAIELINELILSGISARAVVVGSLTDEQLVNYREAMLFKPLVVANEEELMQKAELQPKVVVATLFSTAGPAARFASRKGAALVNFVQGYEIYFDNARWFNEARAALSLSSEVVVTSDWLRTKISPLVPQAVKVHKLQLGANPTLFFPRERAATSDRVRVMVVFRNSPDKGQWVLAEFVDSLAKHRDRFALTVVSPDGQPVPISSEWLSDEETKFAKLPAAKYELARLYREADVLVDASFHEGFGLVPLEAMMSGCVVVSSDSGGVNEFLRDGENGILIREVNKPERFLDAVLSLGADRARLDALRAEALKSAARFESSKSFGDYRSYFARLLGAASH